MERMIMIIMNEWIRDCPESFRNEAGRELEIKGKEKSRGKFNSSSDFLWSE